MKWLTRLFDRSDDPVRHCDLYRDKAASSCAHVDGPLCDFPGCSMLADYRHIEAAASQAGVSYEVALARIAYDTNPTAIPTSPNDQQENGNGN